MVREFLGCDRHCRTGRNKSERASFHEWQTRIGGRRPGRPRSANGERTQMGRDIVTLLPRLRRFAAGLSGSVQDGDDIVQAACLRALERHYQWEPGTRLDSWMFRIIRNLWLDGRKSAWSRLVHNDEEAMAGAPGGSLERELEARNELALARKAIAELPPQQREVLMLVTVE